MRKEVQDDMGDTIQATRELILPLLKQCHPEFKGFYHRIIENPNTKDPIRQHLDTLAGLDIEQYHEQGMRGIASRVQFRHDFRTFTIRTKRPGSREAITEYEKRLWAIQHKDQGYIYPYWTLHSYIVGNEVSSLGVAKTSELYPYIAQQESQGHKFRRKQTKNGEEFLYVPWWQYKQSNNYLYIYTKQSQLEQVHYQMKAKYNQSNKDRYSLPWQDYEDLFELENGMEEADRYWYEQEG